VADIWASLGTVGKHIEVVDYRPEWPQVFERVAAELVSACHPWVTEVHHVGSTSVPGLAAKPILDVMPVVDTPEGGEQAVEAMTALGYQYRGEYGIPGRFYFVKNVESRRVVHVHMLPVGHSQMAMVTFRDYLRANPAVAVEYERLKLRLAVEYQDERDAYTDAKGEFILRTVAAALDDS